MNLTLCLTHDCNLDCRYCYAGEKRRAAMSWDTAQAAIDFAFADAPSAFQVGFFGGEPTLEWDLLVRATEHVEQTAETRGIPLKKTVTTNGTRLTPARAAWLGDHAFFIAVSLDGHRAMHDRTRPTRGGGSSFEDCVAGLRTALAVLPDLEVILVPDPANVEYLAEGIRFLVEEENVRRISVNPNFYTAWDDRALERLRAGFETVGDDAVRWHREGDPPAVNFIDNKILTRLKDGYECRDRCKFGEAEIAVAPSGRIYPCERLVGTDTDDAVCIGTVADGFDRDKRRRLLSQRGNVNAECMTCAIRARCMNWCCCINYTMTGAINMTDGLLCFHERAAVAVADRVASVLFQESDPAFLARFYERTGERGSG